jgi:hypothetical protein
MEVALFVVCCVLVALWGMAFYLLGEFHRLRGIMEAHLDLHDTRERTYAGEQPRGKAGGA